MRFRNTDGSEGSRVALFAKLRHIGCGAPLLFVGTHLKSKPKFEEQRMLEVKMITDEIESAGKCMHGVVVCGDFNTDPDMPSVLHMCDKGLSRFVVILLMHSILHFK